MEDLILPFRVCDARYHRVAYGTSDFEVLFATNELWEAIAAAKDSGGGACVVRVDENGKESVIFINKYQSDLGLKC